MNYDLRINNKNKSGQILILVLLVVVVALAVGLSVASRNLTNLKTSTQAEQSQRAFTAAEGGVEDVLSRLNTVASVISTQSSGGSGCTVVNSEVANCNITRPSGLPANVQVKASKSYEKTVEVGDVAQINLKTYPATKSFDVEWGVSGETGPKPSMEFTFICTNDGNTTCAIDAYVSGVTTTLTNTKVGSQYGQVRAAYQAENWAGQDGFSNCEPGTTYWCKVKFTIKASPAGLEILRMKPFWTRATIKVSTADLSFPVQTYEITSTATTDTGVSRKVEVKRDALPQLPAIFDYVLYSGGDIIK